MSGVQQPPQGESKGAGLDRVRNYFTELRYELKKVTFPGMKEWINSTVVVFVFTMLMMGVISLFDVMVSLIFSKFILPPA